MTYEVFAFYIDKFGDKQIDSWEFNNKYDAIKFQDTIKEKRYEPNQYQKANKLQGSKYYYRTEIDFI
jgi:hypothetical protein